MEEFTFQAGMRIRAHWANDDSVLECNLVSSQFEHPDDLAFAWAGQMVQFIEGATGSLTYIFNKDDVTLEVLSTPEVEAQAFEPKVSIALQRNAI